MVQKKAKINYVCTYLLAKYLKVRTEQVKKTPINNLKVDVLFGKGP